MNKNSIDDISEIINEKISKLYNNAIAMANISLLNHYKDDPVKWKQRQMLDTAKYKNDVNNLVKKNYKDIMNSITTAILLASKIADGTLKDIDTTGKVINVKIDRQVEKRIKEIQNNVGKVLNQLPNTMTKYQTMNITQVYNSIMADKKAGRLPEMYEAIQKYAGREKPPKIVYKDGKKMGFENYATMVVRTELQNETRTIQQEYARNAGLVFYLCSSHSDCANDHADYQGKIYVDEDWETIITDESIREQVRGYIDMNKVKTIQEIESAPYYLNTRPNCRHYFIPMNTDEVLTTSVTTMLKDNKMIKGTYDKQNYIDLQHQRYDERQIRKLKTELDTQNVILKNTPAGSNSNETQNKINTLTSRIKGYEKDLRDLIKENDSLERDRDRENPKIILRDLGYRYKVEYYKK